MRSFEQAMTLHPWIFYLASLSSVLIPWATLWIVSTAGGGILWLRTRLAPSWRPQVHVGGVPEALSNEQLWNLCAVCCMLL